MSLYSRFTAWLSGWPESMVKREREEEYLFAEEEQMIRKNNNENFREKKPKGLKPKKKPKK
jgi:hypothetical protein